MRSLRNRSTAFPDQGKLREGMLSAATETLGQEALEALFDEAIVGDAPALRGHRLTVGTDGERRKPSFATSRVAGLWPPPAE